MSPKPPHRLFPFVAAGLLLLACTTLAHANGPDLNLLALDWARGRYLSPVICETNDKLTRGGRRILIAPGPRHTVPPVVRILFSDLEVPDASRCFDDLGKSQPNVTGQVQVRLLGHSRSDTATRDFKTALRRKSGFTFHISSGQLRIETVGQADARTVLFRGGEARLHLIAPGSDEARMLGDLQGLRKLNLELEAPDGTLLQFPLFMTELR
jgi:hypothetical protein